MGGLPEGPAGHPDAGPVAEIEAKRYANTPFGDPVLGELEPERAALRAAVDELIRSGFRDPEGLFYQVIRLAHAGDSDRAVEILSDVIDRGFYPYETFASHAWLDPLRHPLRAYQPELKRDPWLGDAHRPAR